MLNVHLVSGEVCDIWRRSRIYNGDIIIFKSVPALIELCDLINKKAMTLLETEPVYAHTKYDHQRYLELIGRLQQWYSRNYKCISLIRQAVYDCGVSSDETACEWSPLRVITPRSSHQGRQTATLGIHRDSWHENIYQQTNWWSPIYDIEPANSLRFYPSKWDKKVKNTSKGWSLEKYRKIREEITKRGGSFQELSDAYPPPVANEKLNSLDGMNFLIEPGDFINFSLAHLHEGVPNETARARFSIELRTINLEDFKNGVGARNVDSASTTNDAVDSFHRMSDGKPLADFK